MIRFDLVCTVMNLSFRTFRPGQTVQTQIRLLLEEQSDQCLHCLLFHLHVYAPNFEKVGGHIGFGLSVCMYVCTYVCMYVFMFEISS